MYYGCRQYTIERIHGAESEPSSVRTLRKALLYGVCAASTTACYVILEWVTDMLVVACPPCCYAMQGGWYFDRGVVVLV